MGWYRDAVKKAGKLAEPPMDVPMFDVPAEPRRRSNVCQCPGPMKAWNHEEYKHQMYLEHPRHPKCNRFDGHEGPHRQYSMKAGVMAEW